MPPVMNRSEVQTQAALPPKALQSKALPGQIAAPASADKKSGSLVSAPVGSIASLESRLGF
ncbi:MULTISPECIES: hypothetical protein [unclassified Ancylobacter]|uniref:hypothetical protein n=1 Tax=unclassified Ancylobacter TaxID=2626613 RepID=UPI00226D5B43|nr:MULTISPECIES: hypothetical protein [unclassified Ancylobacter]WAC25701.1 hypothetical protein OU996_11705 [Ancylobacter sp. SL191]WGD31927.1 hypothetical protein AncyloWKF20_08940 [Ancylobacter sp. WKF20]